MVEKTAWGIPGDTILGVQSEPACIGWWFPWVLPGSTRRFYKDDVVHNHSAHGYYITRMEGGVRYAWYCYMLKQNERKLSKNCHPHNTIIGSGYIWYDRLFEWWDEQSRCTYMMWKLKNYRYVVLHVNVAAGHSRGPAQEKRQKNAKRNFDGPKKTGLLLIAYFPTRLHSHSNVAMTLLCI